MVTRIRKQRAVIAPLTRRERSILKQAKAYGLNAFGFPRGVPKKQGVPAALALLTDLERACFFDDLGDFCYLTSAIRGEN